MSEESVPLVPLEPSATVWSYRDIFDFHARVRSVLNNTSSLRLTDEQIDMQEKAPFAELKIRKVVPNWAEYKENDPEKFALFESCIVYQTAIFFESYVKAKQPKSMQSSSISIEYSTSGNIKDTTSIPLSKHLDEILSLLEDENATKVFYGFMVT